MASEECVLAVQSDGTDRAFHCVTVHFDAAVSQKQAQSIPVFCDVFESFAQRGFGRQPRAVGREPLLKRDDQRCRLVLPCCQSHLGCQTPDILFDQVERSDLFQPVFGDGGSARLCNFVQFAACVGPAVGQDDIVIGAFE